MIITAKASEMIKIELVMSKYPLSLAIAGNELCLYDWEQDQEIFALPISDEQATLIREALKRVEVYNRTHDAEGFPIEEKQFAFAQ